MRGIEMNTNDSSIKGLAELDPHMWDHQMESRDRVSGSDGHGILEEWRINEDRENANGGFVNSVHSEVVQRRQQQPPQGPVVQSDRFLPLRSLKVLLVENKDSTRHIVGALLRNCGYEVVAVTNGVDAWKILEDPTNHIDLVLTEVVMPCLSGIGLLSKSKRHKVSNHIPVIMMSSNDSVSMVVKCLSKGAVDFLVKPIRKNELKNLWQHVWRKRLSSSGSGSESGLRTQNLMKTKGVEGPENNTSSNNENDNGSVGLIFKDESANGIGTQSSSSKRVVEVDRNQQLSALNQLADPHETTRAQDIHSRPEAISSNWVPKNSTKECCREDEFDHVTMGQDLEIGIPTSPHLRLEDANEKVRKSVMENERPVLESEPMNGKWRNKAVDFTLDKVTNCTNRQVERVANEVPNDPLSKTEDRGVVYVANELSSLELRLKRQRVEGDVTVGTQVQNILRPSGLSAFKRYNASTDNQAPAGYKDEDDMGSTNDYVFNEPEAANNLSIPVATAKAYRPDTTKAVHQQVQVQHHHHYHHHHHHHVRNVPKQHELNNHGDLSNCRPSNVLTGPNEGQAANYMTYSLSGSGSGSGSINRSNGENSGGDNGSGTGSRGGPDQNRLTQREVALYKFRQKKRDRCFDKKVRYQNRKRLAERRPHVRGQFVRQAMNM